MAFDLDKIKQNLSPDKLKGTLLNSKNMQGLPEKWASVSKNSKLVEFKEGLQDIKNVLAEGKFALFAKQVVVLVAVFLVVKTVNATLVDHRAKLKDQISAITIQQTNKDDYLNNKDYLLHLEPLFPDNEQMSDWMPKTLMTLFAAHDLDPKLDGNFSSNAQRTYTVVSQSVSWKQSYNDLGKMLADMENGDDFLRVSDISIVKSNAKEELGYNTVTLKFNTVFPKEKYGPKLFKDYKQQMDKIEAQKQQAATKQAETKAKAEEKK